MTLDEFRQLHTRRAFLRQSAAGLGTLAPWHLLRSEGRAEDAPAESRPISTPLRPRPPRFPAKAKNIIFLYMEGGPSQIDLFDPKPDMKEWDGQSLPHP